MEHSIDREKVIAGLMMLVDSKNDDTCEGLKCCKIAEDALAILKEQEAVKPKKATNPDESEYCCGICGYPLWLDEFYCAHCGRRIEWEGR